jgi:hypothetical protein
MGRKTFKEGQARTYLPTESRTRTWPASANQASALLWALVHQSKRPCGLSGTYCLLVSYRYRYYPHTAKKRLTQAGDEVECFDWYQLYATPQPRFFSLATSRPCRLN